MEQESWQRRETCFLKKGHESAGVARQYCGLTGQEVRSWTGWHRHTALVLAAGAFLSVLRFQLEGLPEISSNPLFLMTRKPGSLDVFKGQCCEN